MRNNSFIGMSEAAQVLERVQETIVQHQRSSVTLSRQQTLAEVFHAFREADEGWKVSEGDNPISEEVMEIACRFVESLPFGIPSPTVAGEPDGHISFEWYKNSRRLLTVSIGPGDRLHWAALIGSEDPRGSGRFDSRIPDTILFCIQRVLVG